MAYKRDNRIYWKQWVEDEKVNIYSLAFFLTGDEPAAVDLTGQALALVCGSCKPVSKSSFLGAVTGSMFRLWADQVAHSRQGQKLPSGKQELVFGVLLKLEEELRLVVLYYCFLYFDRQALAEKLEWPQEKLNARLDLALRQVQHGFAARGLIKPN